MNAPSASAGLDNLDQTIALSGTHGAVDRAWSWRRAGSTRRATSRRRRPIRSARRSASRASRRSARSPAVRPARERTGAGREQPLVSGRRHAIRAGVDVLYNDSTSRFRARFAAVTASRIWRISSRARTAIPVHADVRHDRRLLANPQRRRLRAGRVEGRPASPPTRCSLRPAVSRDHSTRRDNVSPRVGLVWSPDRSQRTVIRASAGLFYDRVPLRALANALLSAEIRPTSRLRQISVRLSPAQSGAPMFPNILADACRPSRSSTSRPWTPGCRTRIPDRRVSSSSGQLARARRSASGTSTCAVSDCSCRSIRTCRRASHPAATTVAGRIRPTPTTTRYSSVG